MTRTAMILLAMTLLIGCASSTQFVHWIQTSLEYDWTDDITVYIVVDVNAETGEKFYNISVKKGYDTKRLPMMNETQFIFFRQYMNRAVRSTILITE